MDACGPLTTSLRGQLAWVEPGGCTSLQKTKMVESAGGSGVLIHNTVAPQSFSIAGCLVYGQNDEKLGVVDLFLNGDDDLILNTLKSNTVMAILEPGKWIFRVVSKTKSFLQVFCLKLHEKLFKLLKMIHRGYCMDYRELGYLSVLFVAA